MALPNNITKKLAAASSNNIAASQSGSAATALLLNGSASNYLSTTTTAATAAGGTLLSLTSVTGLVAGQIVSDATTASAIPSGVTIASVGASSVTLNKPVGGPGVGSGDTIVFLGVATIDAATAANVAIGRRVAIAYTGTDTSFAIAGTNSAGNSISDIAVGSSGAAQSNLDFVTVTSIVPVGGGLTGVTAGTNGVGSSPWIGVNWHSPIINIGIGVIVTGTVNYTVQHTFDDPNNLPSGVSFPATFNHPSLASLTASDDGDYIYPIVAMRLLVNSGTGTARMVVIQSDISGS